VVTRGLQLGVEWEDKTTTQQQRENNMHIQDRRCSLTIVMAALLLAAASVQAQDTPGYVTATGSARLERTPTAIEMSVQLLGRGATPTDALADLKKRQATAREVVGQLGAIEDSIELGSPSLSNEYNAQRENFLEAIQQRMRGHTGPVPKGLQLPKSITVTSTMNARWKLSATDIETFMIESHALIEKIKAADPGGAKSKDDLSPEEEEWMEEMQGVLDDMGEEMATPGEPDFMYIAQIDAQEREKLLADAVAMARTKATELTVAAGAQLGKLASIESEGDSPDMSEVEMYGYGVSPRYRRYRRMLLRQQMLQMTRNENESYAHEPESIVFSVMVRMRFYLK
jgi:uncharacterized protein YggE